MEAISKLMGRAPGLMSRVHQHTQGGNLQGQRGGDHVPQSCKMGMRGEPGGLSIPDLVPTAVHILKATPLLAGDS